MNHALTRRGFLALTGAALVAGCGSEAQTSETRGGGVLRAVFAGGGTKETLDPHAQNLFVDQARHKAVFDKLFELGDDLAPVPRLVSEFESTSDASTWRLRLREARFHDGALLTADDVLASLARVLDPAVPGRIGQASLSVLDLPRCRAVDARTVELVTSRPAAELPALLAVAGTAIVRAGFDPATPVGTGPFRFVSFEPGRSFVARRFDEHREGAPLLDELHVLSADAEARGNAVRGGQAEYAHEMSPTFARTAGAVQLVETPGCTTQAIAVKTDRVPPDVVRALKLLVDRQRMVLGVSHATAAACVVSLLVRRCGPSRGAALAVNGAGMSLGVFVGAAAGGLGLGLAGYPGMAVALGGATALAVLCAIRGAARLPTE